MNTAQGPLKFPLDVPLKVMGLREGSPLKILRSKKIHMERYTPPDSHDPNHLRL